MEVFTEEWAGACCEALNRAGVYAVAAAEWEEGASVLSMAADPAHGIGRVVRDESPEGRQVAPTDIVGGVETAVRPERACRRLIAHGAGSAR